MRRIGLLIFLLSAFFFGSAQENLPLQNEILSPWIESLNRLEANFHTSVRPYLATEFNATMPRSYYRTSDSVHYWTLQPQFSSFSKDTTLSAHSFSVQPFFRASYLTDSGSDSAYFGRGLGAGITYAYTNKFAGNFSFLTDNSPWPAYLRPMIDSFNALPGMGYAYPTREGYSFTFLSGYASWSPHRIFNFQTGSGKHFFGDGHRSLLLSDNAYNYPYVRLSATFWRVKYVVLYSMMHDIRNSDGNRDLFRRKYTSTHYLNWNISRRVSLGIFETVIWQAKDSSLNRQFDVNYLNPFVFYRPVEYAQGSADNVLLGANLKVSISDHYQIYGQFLLDEFLLKEIRADSGWWANKSGFQIGAKAFSPFGCNGLQLQAEFNYVRPFTYSHRSVTQNWGHFGAPLAHPLGANFREWVFIARYQWRRMQIENQFTWAIYGSDISSTSWGGDLFKSYSQRARNYHNHVGQGFRNEVYFNQFRLSWVFSPTWNLRVFASHQFRGLNTESGKFGTHFIQFGLSSWLWNQYLDR